MNTLLRDTWVWATALELAKNYGFQIVDFPFSQKEKLAFPPDQEQTTLLLIRNKGRKYQMIRLLTVDSVWPSMITRNIREFADQVPGFCKRLKASHLTVENVYVFSYGQDHMIEDTIKDMQKIEEKKSILYSSSLFISSDTEYYGHTENYFQKVKIGFEHVGIGQEQLTPAVTHLVQTKSLWEIKRELEEEEARKEKEFNQIFHFGKPILTSLFLIINIVMFAFLEWVGSSTDVSTLIKYGAKWNPSMIEGEYWRFFTPMFLHIGLLHITFNGLALYFLGSVVERIYGSIRFLWIYLFSGFTGIAASFAFTANVAAGASGAIFGCFGALLYFGLKRRDLFFRTLGTDIIFILVFNLAIGAAIPMIDNYAHVGGLAGGFLAAMMVHLPYQRFLQERITALAIGAVATYLLIQVGFTQDLDDPIYHLIQSELEMKEENWEQAGFHLEQAIQHGNDQAEIYLQLGVIYNQENKYMEAEKTLLQAQVKGADQAELFFHLSYAQVQQNKYEEGRLNLLQTLERNPEMVEAYYNLSLVYIELNQKENALEILEEAQELNISDPQLTDLQQKILDQP